MVLQIMDDGTWRLDHEGETDEVSSGVWSASSGKATLFFSDGSSVFAEFEREGDKLIENDGEEHLSWDAWLAARPEAPVTDDGMAELCGIWEDSERGGYLELEDSGFWAHYNDQGGWTSSGPWKVENGQVLLYDNNTDELVRELGIAVSGDLLDGEGGRLTPAEGVETPWAGIEAYVGTWEYLDWEGAMLELRYDDTWTLYLNGEILQEGTWAIYNGYAYTYDDEGAYNTTLTPDVGGLIADGEYLVPSAGADADYDEEADAAAWAEIASLDGYWYEK
jgi:hypothetical protein